MINPPLKIQGKKTKLVEAITETSNAVGNDCDVWVEPFFGTGVVGFNCPENFSTIIAGDTNPYTIAFYDAINRHELTADNAHAHLSKHGRNLLEGGYEYYRKIRDRFNHEGHDLMDFLFLSRTSFNGMMRFNRRGEWNVPFCKIPNRLNEKNVDELCKSIDELSVEMKRRNYLFFNLPYDKLMEVADGIDGTKLFYCDPPYYGLYTEYFNGWEENDERRLSEVLKGRRFILSTWADNGVTQNPMIGKYWSGYGLKEIDHRYCIGATAERRRGVKEALIFSTRKENK